jgi:hypothetical protein
MGQTSYRLKRHQIVRDVILSYDNRYYNTKNINDRYTKIIIKMDDGDLILTAEGDCSNSWFEKWNVDFNYLIGKTIKGFDSKIEQINLPQSDFFSYNDYEENHLCQILFSNISCIRDENAFTFVLRNSSNGYYSGFISYEFIKTKPKRIINTNSNSKIICNLRISIFIGLPCSGKTTLMKNTYPNAFHYDDFIHDITPKEVINKMNSSSTINHICFADPRLCNYVWYNKLIDIITTVINENYIQTILFENDVDSCINNFNKTPSKHPKIINDIKNMSKNYSTDKEYINSIVIPVYKE